MTLGSIRSTASPIIFKNNFETPPGSISFITPESSLFTQIGDTATLQVVVKDHLGNVVNDGIVQWSLSSSNNLFLTNEASRSVHVNANGIEVETVILSAYHRGVNALAKAYMVVAELSSKTHLIFDSDIISGNTPVSNEQTTVRLSKNSRTDKIVVGDYILGGDNKGLMITVDNIDSSSSEHVLLASSASMAEVYESLDVESASKPKKITVKLSSINNNVRFYDQNSGKLISDNLIGDGFSCNFIGTNTPANFTLSDSEIVFDLDVKTNLVIDIDASYVNRFEISSDVSSSMGLSTGIIEFDQEVATGIDCSLELPYIATPPVFVYGLSFRFGLAPSIGFQIGGQSSTNYSISGPTGIIESNFRSGIEYSSANGFSFLGINEFDYQYDILDGVFDASGEFSAYAEAYAKANLALIGYLGYPPAGIEFAQLSFMEAKVAERLSLSLITPIDPNDIDYVGPVANLEGSLTVTPQLELSTSFEDVLNKIGISISFGLSLDSIIDFRTTHWQSPSPELVVPAFIQLGNSSSIVVDSGENNHFGVFNLVSDTLIDFDSGSIENGLGSLLWEPQDKDVGVHHLAPRVELDDLSRFLPYAGISKTLEVVEYPVAMPIPLNDTGITWGGHYSIGNNSQCLSNIMAPQDCNFGYDAINNDDTDGLGGFSYTKIDSIGNEIPASAETWSCVKDNVTGLIWEVKTEDGSIHDKDNVYRWGGLTRQGDHGSIFYDDWNSLVSEANLENYCGLNNWRVPSILELSSLTNKGTSNPSIDINYFPNTVSNSYWSSSPLAKDVVNAWNVRFDLGDDRGTGRGNPYRVRLVSSQQ